MRLLSSFLLIFLSLQLTSADLPSSFLDILTRKDFVEKSLPKDVPVRASVTYQTIQQRVNHFNPQDHRTFTNFYAINEEHFQPGGPLIFFFYISPLANGLAGLIYASFGPIFDFAMELNGTIIAPEHRYYENSIVTEDLSDDNLRFLTVGQSLEDLAHLITNLKSQERYRDSGVILVGWDYGGSYATWFAQKYPHLVNGVWASGARIFQTLEQQQPASVVENITRTFGSEECFNRSSNAFKQLEDMIANNQSRIIERTFKLCYPIPYQDDQLDIWMFFEVIGVYHYTYAALFDEEIFRNEACGGLMNAPVGEDFEALAYALGFHTIPTPLCYPISFRRDTNWAREIELNSEQAPNRLLLYQYCSEFGYFWNSGDGTTFFGNNFPIDFFVEICHTMFGTTREQLETNFARFNVLYGGRNPGVRNGYFTYGELYPWISFGVSPESLHNSSIHELIPNRSLQTEFGFEFDPDMDAVRARVLVAAKRWLGIPDVTV